MKLVSLLLIVVLMSSLVMAVEVPFGKDTDWFHYQGSIGGFQDAEDLQLRGVRPGENEGEGATYKINDEKTVVKYKHKGDEEGKVRSFRHMKQDSKLTFEGGELTKAEFTVEGTPFGDGNYKYCVTNADSEVIMCSVSANYKIGNREYELKHGDKLEFQKGEEGERDIVKITPADGAKVKTPKKINDKVDDSGTEIRYDLEKDDGHLLLEGHKVGKFGDKENGWKDLKLGYDPKQEAFFVKGASVVGGLEIGVVESSKSHLYFEEAKIPVEDELGGSYLLLDKRKKEFRAYAPTGTESPTVRFMEENDFGINVKAREVVGSDGRKVKKDVFFTLQALGRGHEFVEGKKKDFTDTRSLVTIKPGKTGELPDIRTEGSYAILSGNRLVRYNPIIGSPRVRDFKSLQVDNQEIGLTGNIGLDDKAHVGYRLASVKADKKMISFDYKGKKVELKYPIFMDSLGVVRAPTTDKEIDLYNRVVYSNLDLDRQKQIELMVREGVDINPILKNKDINAAIDLEVKKKEAALGGDVLKNAIGGAPDKNSFMSNVKSKTGVTALRFSATWCGPCKEQEKDYIKPNKDKISGTLYKIDGNKRKDLIGKYRITEYPTTVYLDKNGKEIGRYHSGNDYITRMNKIFNGN